jgi:signal transduction histidine kinase
VLGRLSQYNHYLENMAARLSHEIRTPVAVVKSSLENLELIEDKNSEQAHTFVHRAKEGLARLSLILHSMSEATRLEQVLQGYQKSEVDLVPLLEHYVHGLNAYSATPVVLHCEPQTMVIKASPDLLTQMLDKVTSNAMDFAFEGSTIDIYLRGNGAIEVVNTGPAIKAAMKEELFNLMVSVRDKNTDALHLGLGLYMAKLIAEFHEMAISIDNGEQDNQVVVKIEKGGE